MSKVFLFCFVASAALASGVARAENQALISHRRDNVMAVQQLKVKKNAVKTWIRVFFGRMGPPEGASVTGAIKLWRVFAELGTHPLQPRIAGCGLLFDRTMETGNSMESALVTFPDISAVQTTNVIRDIIPQMRERLGSTGTRLGRVFTSQPKRDTVAIANMVKYMEKWAKKRWPSVVELEFEEPHREIAESEEGNPCDTDRAENKPYREPRCDNNENNECPISLDVIPEGQGICAGGQCYDCTNYDIALEADFALTGGRRDPITKDIREMGDGCKAARSQGQTREQIAEQNRIKHLERENGLQYFSKLMAKMYTCVTLEQREEFFTHISELRRRREQQTQAQLERVNAYESQFQRDLAEARAQSLIDERQREAEARGAAAAEPRPRRPAWADIDEDPLVALDDIQPGPQAGRLAASAAVYNRANIRLLAEL